MIITCVKIITIVLVIMVITRNERACYFVPKAWWEKNLMRSPVFAFAFLLLLATDKSKHSSLSSKFLLLIFFSQIWMLLAHFVQLSPIKRIWKMFTYFASNFAVYKVPLVCCIIHISTYHPHIMANSPSQTCKCALSSTTLKWALTNSSKETSVQMPRIKFSIIRKRFLAKPKLAKLCVKQYHGGESPNQNEMQQ